MISISGRRQKRSASITVTTKKIYYKRITYYECVLISLHFRRGIINETLVQLESICCSEGHRKTDEQTLTSESLVSYANLAALRKFTEFLCEISWCGHEQIKDLTETRKNGEFRFQVTSPTNREG